MVNSVPYPIPYRVGGEGVTIMRLQIFSPDFLPSRLHVRLTFIYVLYFSTQAIYTFPYTFALVLPS